MELGVSVLARVDRGRFRAAGILGSGVRPTAIHAVGSGLALGGYGDHVRTLLRVRVPSLATDSHGVATVHVT